MVFLLNNNKRCCCLLDNQLFWAFSVGWVLFCKQVSNFLYIIICNNSSFCVKTFSQSTFQRLHACVCMCASAVEGLTSSSNIMSKIYTWCASDAWIRCNEGRHGFTLFYSWVSLTAKPKPTHNSRCPRCQTRSSPTNQVQADMGRTFRQESGAPVCAPAAQTSLSVSVHQNA